MSEPNLRKLEFVACSPDGEEVVLTAILAIHRNDRYFLVTSPSESLSNQDERIEIVLFEMKFDDSVDLSSVSNEDLAKLIIQHFEKDYHGIDFSLETVTDEELIRDMIEGYSEDIYSIFNGYSVDDDNEDQLYEFCLEGDDGEEHYFIIWDTFFYIDRKFHLCYEVPEDFDLEDIKDFDPVSYCFVEIIGWEEDVDDIEESKEWIVVSDESLSEELDEYYREMTDEENDE